MKKRILSLVLAFVMVFSLAVPTFAADAAKPVADQVKLLEGLGLLTGEGGGVTPEYLAKEMTRIQAACALLKMVGKYDEAKVFVPTENFPDATGAWAEGNNIMGYLKANPNYGFSGDAGKFNPTGTITQQELFKVVLTQLAYMQDVDYKWEEVTTFGVGKGLVSVEGVYNTQALAQNVYSALTVPNKTTKATIAEELAKDEAKKALLVAAGLIAGENVELEAVSAEFMNLRQIKVTFNRAPAGDDLDAAEDVTNYTVNTAELKEYDTTMAGDEAVVEVSGKEAVITLQGASIAGKVKNGTTTNSVEYGDAKFDKLSAIDKDFPTIVGYTVNGPREIELEFSEAVLAKSSAIKLNNGTISTSVDTPEYSNFIVVKTFADLKDGEYTLTIKADDSNNNKIVDGAGYPVLAQDYKINVVKDTVAPTVAVADGGVTAATDKITVKVKFDKNVTMGNLKAKLGHAAGTDGKIVTTGKDSITGSGKKYTITFATGSAPGTQTIYFVNGATKAKDTWGNVFEDQTLAFDIVLDTEAPTVKSIVAKDSNTLVVTFSEKVEKEGTSGKLIDATNFVIKDSKNATVTLATADGVKIEDEKVTLTMAKKFTGGVYTVEVKKIQDMSMYKNKLVATTISVDTKDKVAPYIKSATQVGATGSDTNKYVVVFSEAMDAAAANKSNWKTSEVSTGDNSVVVNSVSMASDSKSITIDLKIKGTGAFTPGAKGDPSVSNLIGSIDSLLDLAGNKLVEQKVAIKGDVLSTSEVTAFTAAVYTLASASTPKVTANKIQVMDRKTIKITFEDSIMEGIDGDTFTVTGNDNKEKTVTGIGMEVTGNSDSIITLTLDEKLPGTEADSLKNIKANGTTAKNQYGYVIDTDNDLVGLDKVASPVLDKAAPELLSAVLGTWSENVTDVDKSTQDVVFTFSEDLYVPSVADADFTVDGYEVGGIDVVGSIVTVTLKNVGAEIKGEILTTLVGSVQDAANKNATTENTELTAITKVEFDKLVASAKSQLTVKTVTLGASIVVPSVTDCTVTYTAEEAVVKDGKFVATGTVTYTLTSDLCGLSEDFDINYTVS